MARFTVSDCMNNISNRFDMTLVAIIRAGQISKGSKTLLLDDENDKVAVLALREIAEELIDVRILKNIE